MWSPQRYKLFFREVPNDSVPKRNPTGAGRLPLANPSRLSRLAVGAYLGGKRGRSPNDHRSTLARVHDHVRGCARLLGCFVEATADLGRENKVIFKMWDVFEKYYFMIECDVIEEHQVLM
jgi:hypothetical protein